jgi:hypothetical protein
MKTLLTFFLCFFFTVLSFSKPKENLLQTSSIIRTQVISDGNNISTWIWNTGVFNQDMRTNNTPGFEWPKGSGKFAIFTSGLSIGAFVNDSLRLASASYSGEYGPGYILNGVPMTSDIFKLYKVKRGDNNNTNPDYANWGLMIPYGAPFEDINNNGVYDAGIDKPGVKNAIQTIFICLTDGFPETHSASEGFSGGTAPLKAEMHLTAWSYDNIAGLEDVQFLKMEIINKNFSAWEKTHFGFVADPDLGDGNDDYVGCDVSRNLGYCYNADDVDGTGSLSHYGASPPAVGIDMLKGAVNRNITPNADLYMTSFSYYGNGGPSVCETDPSGGPMQAYNYLRGLKKDSTKFVNPVNMQTTKHCYSGDPEPNIGWTEYTGKINNCGGDTTGSVVFSTPGDRRCIIGSGASNLKIVPGEKQTFMFAQMVAKGTNNKNSVTKLKTLDDAVQAFYNANLSVGINQLSAIIPDRFNLYQNYPNPFNPTTKIKFDIDKSGFASLSVYDVTGKEIAKLVSQNLVTGTYEYEFNGVDLPSGIYFYKLETPNSSSVKKMSLIK